MTIAARTAVFFVTILAAWAGLAAEAAMADGRVTIVATVSDGFQLIGDDGQPYEVENTAQGNELVMHHVGHKVEVVGTVVDEIDYKIITVEDFRILEE